MPIFRAAEFSMYSVQPLMPLSVTEAGNLWVTGVRLPEPFCRVIQCRMCMTAAMLKEQLFMKVAINMFFREAWQITRLLKAVEWDFLEAVLIIRQ
ncbi:hypothetical protein NI40_008880 [Enterobacter sp. E20]|nr:hypothetical protein NI40_008880 [Enterobacter sp. E20]